MKIFAGLSIKLSIITASLFLFVHVQSAHAIEYGGLGGRPAFPRPDNPRTESIFIHTLEKGSIQDEGVRVINNTPEKKTISVYAADSTPSTGGAFACKQFSEEKIDVGSWIELEKNEVELEPGTNEVIPFKITIPQNADVGEHNGCILIQEKKTEDNSNPGVNLSFRTGLRVAITIPGEIVRMLEIVEFKVVNDENIISLLPRVKNTGNVSIDADVKVVTSYLWGQTYFEHGGQYPVLSGNTSDWNFELNKPFWGGFYKSRLVVEYDEKPETELGITGESYDKRLESQEVMFFAKPSSQALVIELGVLLLLIFMLYILWLSAKRRKWIKDHWVEYRVRADEDINAIAKKYEISWKLIAKVNKLKAPYVLNAGDKIKVPPKQ